MKKLISLILCLVLVFCFAGCGTADTPSGDNGTEGTHDAGSNVAAAGYAFNYNGTAIAMNAETTAILAALGEPVTYTEEASCAFTGMDKTYFFGSFYLQTYPMNDQDYVYSVWFVDDSVSTDEGVYIGMDQASVENIYGADAYNGTNAYTLTKGDSKLTVIITDGCVSSIQYDAIVE